MFRSAVVAALVAAAGLIAPPAGAQDDDPVRARAGKFQVESRGYFTRILHDGVLWGTQINENYLVRADGPIPFCVLTPWDVLMAEGAMVGWNATHEPLTYYHRTGPVGAVFHHARSRKGGADANAPFGVVGLNAGTPAAYARRGQAVTFYESHRELRKLVVNSDRHFTYLRDARDRGATVDVKFGPTRTTLAADAGARFAVLLVEMFEHDFDPGDRLTLEAVRLYFDRVTADGLVALHISNKEYRLEPVVERIARELKMVGRVWNDDSESRPGKTASSWVVLARSEAALGDLGKSAVEQAKSFGTRNEPLVYLLNKYGPDKNAMEAILAEWGGPESERNKLTPSLMSVREGPQAAVLYQFAIRIRDAGRVGLDATLGKLTEYIFGPMFRRLEADTRVGLRTDDDRPDLPLIPRTAPKQ